MVEMVIREDKISGTRRFFGILFLLIACLILSFALDKSLCVFSGVFESSCRQMDIQHPNWELIKEALTQKSLKLFKGPLGIGLLLSLFFSVLGTFFGFFHGKQTLFRGQIMVRNYLFGMCIRTTSMATLSHYKEIKLIKEMGTMAGPHGIVREGIKVFHVNLVGESETKGVGIFLKYEEAKVYAERLSSVISLPLKNEGAPTE